MSKAILIIDNVQEEWFKDNLSCKFQLLYYPNGEMKELGISGKHHLKPLPNEISHSEIEDEYDYWEIEGYNKCLKELLGGEEE